MSGLTEHVIETFGITQAIADAIGGADAATYRAVTGVFEGRRHEPIVRCRDCRKSTVERHKGDPERVCWRRKSHGEVVDDRHYCGYGERGDDAC